jgi:hypothetical protein
MKFVLATLILTTTLLAQSGERLKPDHLPTPFTAEQIRKGCGEGRTTTWLLTSPGKWTAHQSFTFSECDKEGCKLSVKRWKPDGTVIKEGSSRGTWKTFQSHASYLEKTTKLTKETIKTKVGKLECLVYTNTLMVNTSTQVTKYYFATKLPGPPVRLEMTRDGKTTYTMEIVEHKPGKKVE